MNRRLRSPSDLGTEVWDLALDHTEAGMPREIALAHMTDPQFQIAKVWDKDHMCAHEHKCFLYVYGNYWISEDPLLAVQALDREIALLYRRAIRLHRSAIAPLVEIGRETPQLRVAHTALAGMISAAAPLGRVGFSTEMATRNGAEPG